MSILIFFIVVFLVLFLKKYKQFGEKHDYKTGIKVLIKEKELCCNHCSHNIFQKREGLLTTTWVTLFKLACLNRSARCYACKNCGFVHWFIGPYEQVDIPPYK